MPLTNFVDGVTKVVASWLNSIDILWSTVFGEATTKAAARAALTSDAPFTVAQGGTNATTAAAARTALGAAASGANTDITSLGPLTGLLDLSPGTSGQIKFPAVQNPSADVNTMDDYEEGSWTPSVGGTATYTLQTGQYVKVGKFVFLTAAVIINTIGTGSVSTISGLPFDADATQLGTVQILVVQTLAVSIYSIHGVVSNGAAPTIQFRGFTAASISDSLLNLFGNGAQVKFSAIYIAAQ